MNTPETSINRSLIYWHSEGLSLQPPGSDNHVALRVNSANLIDFMVSVARLAAPSVICGPTIQWNGNLTLPAESSLLVTDGKLQLTSRLQTIATLPRFFYSLLLGELSKHLAVSSISVSVGLSGTGTIVGLTRTLLLRKPHAFIVRGDRLTTVTNSSRPYFNRLFVAARIRAYNHIMLRLVKSERAEIWFQGRAHHEKLVNLLPPDCAPRLKVLDAVLRDLPATSGTKEKKYDLIFTGRITVEKGLLELVEALRILSESGLRLSLCIVGDGPDKNTVMRAAERAQVADQIHWMGYLSDTQVIVDLLGSSRIFVLPSYTEGLPRSLLEAASIGLPCIATPVGGIPFLFKHDESIFLVPVKDSDALARQIKETHHAENDAKLGSVKTNAKALAYGCSFINKAQYFYDNACLETTK